MRLHGSYNAGRQSSRGHRSSESGMGRDGITMTDIHPSVQLSGKRLSRETWAIYVTGEAPTLTTGRSPDQVSS